MGKKEKTITFEEAMKMIEKTKRKSLMDLYYSITGSIGGFCLITGLTALTIWFVIWAIKLLIGVIA